MCQCHTTLTRPCAVAGPQVGVSKQESPCPYIPPSLSENVHKNHSCLVPVRLEHSIYIIYIFKQGPPTCLGLVCYTSLVKRCSEAMDFLKTPIPEKIFALEQSLKEIHSFAPSFYPRRVQTNPRHIGGPYLNVVSTRELENSPNLLQNMSLYQDF